jgi:hypothetical protein
MVDGWFARFRGPGWGRKKTQKERVEWHEIKNGVEWRLVRFRPDGKECR